MEKGAYLVAMVSSVGHAEKVLVGPSIQIGVFSADHTIASVARSTFTAIHGVTEVAQVMALGIPVAGVSAVMAGVTRLADLRKPTVT